MKRKRISIKWKIFFYLIGFCILLLGILWLFQIVFLEQFYKSIKRTEVEKTSKTIVELAKAEDFDSILELANQRGDLLVEVWQPGLGTVWKSDGGKEGVLHQLTEPDKQQLMNRVRENGGCLIEHFQVSDARFPGQPEPHRKRPAETITFADVLDKQNSPPWLIMVNAMISPVNSTVETIQRQLWYISGFMILLSIGLALLLSRRVADPIMQLNDSARKLGNGDYQASFTGKGYKEIMELSDTLNHAAVELGRIEGLRRELIANVSHDLRTPLTLITGYSEMIRDLPDENTPENMQVIIDESKRLTELVNDMLDLSKLQSGNLKLHMSTVNLTETIEGILNRMQKMWAQGTYDLNFVYEEDVYIRADQDRIAQVIYNLLINAVQYTGADRRVTVYQRVKGARVIIEFADTGAGIAPEEVPCVWERYYRSANRRPEGTGLGLSITRSILECHQATSYGVESEPGRGSVFWFEFPAAAVENGENKEKI